MDVTSGRVLLATRVAVVQWATYDKLPFSKFTIMVQFDAVWQIRAFFPHVKKYLFFESIIRQVRCVSFNTNVSITRHELYYHVVIFFSTRLSLEKTIKLKVRHNRFDTRIFTRASEHNTVGICCYCDFYPIIARQNMCCLVFIYKNLQLIYALKWMLVTYTSIHSLSKLRWYW